MNILIKELTANEVSKKYVRWLNSDDVNQFTEQRFSKHTLSSVKKYVKIKLKSKNEFLFGIFIDNKTHIGNIKLGPINYYHKTAFISYFIGDKKFRSRGIMTEVFQKLIKVAKNKFKLKKIQAGIYEYNLASKKLLIKNKFKLEGSFNYQLLYKNKRCKKLIYGKIIR